MEDLDKLMSIPIDDGDDSTTSSNSPEHAMAGLRDVVENDHRQRSSALSRSTAAAAPGVVPADAAGRRGASSTGDKGEVVGASEDGEVQVGASGGGVLDEDTAGYRAADEEATGNRGAITRDASLDESSGAAETADSAVGALQVPASLRTTNAALERCQAKLEASRAKELEAKAELDVMKSKLAEVTEELEAMRAEARGAKQASSEDRSGGGVVGGVGLGDDFGIVRGGGSHGGGGGSGETKREMGSKGDPSDDSQLRRLLAIREVQLKVP